MDTEKNLKFAKNQIERLRLDYEALKTKNNQTNKNMELRITEMEILKTKLEELWEDKEREVAEAVQ